MPSPADMAMALAQMRLEAASPVAAHPACGSRPTTPTAADALAASGVNPCLASTAGSICAEAGCGEAGEAAGVCHLEDGDDAVAVIADDEGAVAPHLLSHLSTGSLAPSTHEPAANTIMTPALTATRVSKRTRFAVMLSPAAAACSGVAFLPVAAAAAAPSCVGHVIGSQPAVDVAVSKRPPPRSCDLVRAAFISQHSSLQRTCTQLYRSTCTQLYQVDRLNPCESSQEATTTCRTAADRHCARRADMCAAGCLLEAAGA